MPLEVDIATSFYLMYVTSNGPVPAVGQYIDLYSLPLSFTINSFFLSVAAKIIIPIGKTAIPLMSYGYCRLFTCTLNCDIRDSFKSTKDFGTTYGTTDRIFFVPFAFQNN